jgi:NAD(P)-dependent dehydrogenase (short-subunit alcohol dehydrogenase family)
MQQRIWFITGISSGLGQALAQAVIDAGELVIGTFRQQAQAETFNAAHVGKGIGLILNLNDPTSIAGAVAQATAHWGRIDVLVNNAGIGIVGAVEEVDIQEARLVLEANFFGTMQLTQAVLPTMRAQQSGHIFQISSHGGFKGFPGFGIYNASKFALEGMSEALAAELQPLGIHLTIVQPGPFRTDFAGRSLISAARQISDYAATAGAFRQRMNMVNGIQEGDPTKAAQAILAQSRTAQPSLRLPLGKIALNTLKAKLDSVQADLDLHRSTAEGAVFEA